MSYGVVCRRGSDLALLWLWRRSAAVARIRLLAWEPPYALGVALKKKITPLGTYYWYPHFSDEQTEAVRLSNFLASPSYQICTLSMAGAVLGKNKMIYIIYILYIYVF